MGVTLSPPSAGRDRTQRERADRCPGVLRPWVAEDGGLVRLRPVGGLVDSQALVDLVGVSEKYGEGRVHLTSRANLQVRGLPLDGDRLTEEVELALEDTGLLPSRSHELVRNIMVSPQNGFAGGLAQLRRTAAELDERLCVDPRLAELPGRFLFVLDDGRGDLLDRPVDLGLVAVTGGAVQLRLGSRVWGPVVPLRHAARELVTLAQAFLDVRGTGETAAWHVDELVEPLDAPCRRYRALAEVLDVEPEPLPAGSVPGGVHHLAPEGVDRELAEALADRVASVVVTPWRGLLEPTGVSR